MECHGGNGYVEDFILARLYRQAPLNSIWEGSGNVICLDVLRSIQKQPGKPHYIALRGTTINCTLLLVQRLLMLFSKNLIVQWDWILDLISLLINLKPR